MPRPVSLPDERHEALQQLAELDGLQLNEWLGAAISKEANLRLPHPLPGWEIKLGKGTVHLHHRDGIQAEMEPDAARGLARHIRELAQKGGPKIVVDFDTDPAGTGWVVTERRGRSVRIRMQDGTGARDLSWEVARDLADLLERAAGGTEHLATKD